MNKLEIFHRGIFSFSIEISNDTDKSVLQLLQENDISGISAPCNGNGTCGKCKIIVKDGELSEPSDQEKRLLTKSERDGGVRLACLSRVTGDVKLELTIQDFHSGSIAAGGRKRKLVENPTQRFIRSEDLQIGEMSIENQRPVLPRVQQHFTSASSQQHNLRFIRQLSSDITSKYVCSKDGVPVVLCDAEASVFGAAIDLGTTTVVVHLLNLLDNSVVDTISAGNAQKSFGADVISRVQYAVESQEHRDQLARTACSQLQMMIEQLLDRHKIDTQHFIHMSIAGNTTLLHLLIGADAAGIASAPFIPIFTETLHLNAGELGFHHLAHTAIELFPSISGYVGSDISSGIHASGMLEFSRPQLLIDVGTNGEIVLSIGNTTTCCSTAAGPAFEGAGISCGSAGIPGAIDTIGVTDGEIKITTIADQEPASICGSGVIDALAVMLSEEVIDQTGRIDEEHAMVRIIDQQPCFIITSSPSGEQDIYLSQKDIREIQLAKAAIAGGIRTLLQEQGISYQDIEHVFLAGGFGSFINPISAGRIGLIPSELTEKTVAIGNSSSEGAILGTFWAEHREDIEIIAKDSNYIELSSSRYFQDFYIEEMLFPE